jgi:signal transduction histidine kinase
MTSAGRTRDANRRGYRCGVDDSRLRALVARPLGRGQLVALDGLAATLYTAVLLWLTITGQGVAAPGVAAPVWARCLVLAGVGLPVALRRLWPLPVLGAVGATSAVALVVGALRDPFLAGGFAVYTVALTQPGRPRVPTLAVGAFSVAGVVVASVAGVPPSWTPAVGLAVLGSAVTAGAWTVGRAVRERRAYAAHAAEQLAHQAVTEERLRIARELHDVVAHSLSLIAVKAGVAHHVFQARPEEAVEALRVIETTSRSALGEMRHVLGVLRSEGEAGAAAAGLSPAPGIAGLHELARRAAMAGVWADVRATGLEDLPEGVGLSVYRIVQEALTNVVRHAAPARCRVVVEAGGGEVTIDVTDDGPGHRVLPDGAGPVRRHGLVGMRERVAMYGGSFAAGPRPEGGFAVSARLPYHPAETP